MNDLTAYAITFKQTARSRKTTTWTRFYADAAEANADAGKVVAREYGPAAVVLSVAITADPRY